MNYEIGKLPEEENATVSRRWPVATDYSVTLIGNARNIGNGRLQDNETLLRGTSKSMKVVL